MRGFLARASFASVLVAAALAAMPADAFQLITQSEANLPTAPITQISTRGLTRGPTIDQLAPPPDAVSPVGALALKITFAGHNGATIDPASVRVTYLKQPAVDLTPRLKPYITATGIDATGVDVPPGVHLIRIDLTDTEGRSSTVIMKLQVASN